MSNGALAYLAILCGMVALPLNLYSNWKASQERAALQQAGEDLLAGLSTRFEEKYPLGYCLLGFAGAKRIFMPSASLTKIEIDWNKVRILDRTSRGITIETPAGRYRDESHNIMFAGNTFGLRLEPHPGLVMVMHPIAMEVACVRQSQMGLFIVVGFSRYRDATG